VIAGALTLSIVLAQHGLPNFFPGQATQPQSPLAAQVTRGYRVPTLAEAVVARAASRVSEVAAETNGTVEARSRRAARHRLKHYATQRLVMRPSARVVPSRTGRSCDRLGALALARCMRPQILDVDRQLRDAYEDAVRAGVDRRVLTAYRRQWSRLRDRAISDPRSVAVGYRRMAQQLDSAR
jgi:hypothetical protein